MGATGVESAAAPKGLSHTTVERVEAGEAGSVNATPLTWTPCALQTEAAATQHSKASERGTIILILTRILRTGPPSTY
jgi:hypothetical protein